MKRSNLPFLDKNTDRLLGTLEWRTGEHDGARVAAAPDIKAFVLFAPTSPDYADNFNRWTRPNTAQANLVRDRHGWPEDNPDFYKNLSVGPSFKEAVTKGSGAALPRHRGHQHALLVVRGSAALMKEAGIDITFVPVKGENHLFSDAAWRGGVASQFLAFIDKNVKGVK